MKKYLRENDIWYWDENKQKYKEHINKIRSTLILPLSLDFNVAYKDGYLDLPVVMDVTITPIFGNPLTIPYDEYLDAGGSPYKSNPYKTLFFLPLFDFPMPILEIIPQPSLIWGF